MSINKGPSPMVNPLVKTPYFDTNNLGNDANQNDNFMLFEDGTLMLFEDGTPMLFEN
jgi:hypothetical protein